MLNGPHLTKGSSSPMIFDYEKLILYSMRFCPYAQRVHLVLEAKKIPHEVVFINLTVKPDWYFMRSIEGKVPALGLGSKDMNYHLCESLIIADYLDEEYPENPLYPKDPLSKAKDKYLIDRFKPISIAFYHLFSSTTGTSGAPGSLTEVITGLDTYEAELRMRSTPYFCGEQPGMLDYMIWPWCERADMLKISIGDKYCLDKERFEKLLAWSDLMKSDSAVKVSYLSAENHAKFWETHNNGSPKFDILINVAKRQRTS